jgi:hypothetical protein
MEPRHREEEADQIDAERIAEAQNEDPDVEEEEGDLAHRTPPDEDESQV